MRCAFSTCLLLFCLPLLAGCDLFDETHSGREYEVEFWMTDSAGNAATEFRIDDDIMFHWRFTNVSNKEIVWNQPGTFPYVNFYVYLDDPAGEVYLGKTWPSGDYPPSREMKLPPDNALYFEVRWSDDPAHDALPEGQYKIVAIGMINLPYLGEPRNQVEIITVRSGI